MVYRYHNNGGSRMITKSLAGVAAGILLIGGGALATAQADPAKPSSGPTATTTASGASTAQAAGARYPASVVTTTSLRVNSPVERGEAHRARIRVRAGATSTDPRGTVSVVVAGKSRHARLVNGVAVVSMPRWLRAGRGYQVRARYIPRTDSQWQRSSDTAWLRVTR